MSFDTLLKFPATGIAQAVTGLEDFHTALAAGNVAELGAPLDANGDPAVTTTSGGGVSTSNKAFTGARGRAAYTYTDMSGATVTAPAVGDPAYFYVSIRSDVDPAAASAALASHGISVATAGEIAPVLGVWE